MGMILYRQFKDDFTAAAGTNSATIFGTDGDLKQIVVKAATSTTTFDVKLTDINSMDVYHYQDITGELNDLPNLPVYGNWTFTVENASVDEKFDYLFIFKEFN